MSITEQALRESVAGGYRTLKDIGSDFGVTRERIRQLCNKYGIDRGQRPFDTLSTRRQFAIAPRSHWPRERMPALRRRLNLCQRGACPNEAAPGRRRCVEHLELYRIYQMRLHRSRRARGLCHHCDELPAPGHTLCQHHLDALHVSNRRRYQKAAA